MKVDYTEDAVKKEKLSKFFSKNSNLFFRKKSYAIQMNIKTNFLNFEKNF